MALYQPTNISPSSLNGTGVIDATQDLTVSWQINGYGGMVGWQIQIMQNDSASTLVFETQMLHKEKIRSDGTVYYEIIYGKNQSGDEIPFSYTISAGDLSGKVVNGYENGYKLRINQQYTETVNGSVTYVTVTQTSPVFFMAQANWSWVYSWNSTQTHREPSFYALSINSSAPLLWHRWRLTDDPAHEDTLYDSGRIYTDNEPFYSPKNLINGKTYYVRLDGQNTDGSVADTGWFEFDVQYTLTSNEHIRCKAYYVSGMPCTYVTLEADSDANRYALFAYYGWGVYRVKTGSNLMELAAIIPNGRYSFYDFGIKNNTEYTYEVFGNFIGNGAPHYTSNAVKMSNYWNWSLVETVKRDYAFDHDGYDYPSNHPAIYNSMYHVTKVYQFQGNVKSGSVTNGNSPFVGENFTGYPIVQKSSRKALSGTLKGMTGLVKNCEYTDSIETNDSIQGMSSSETVKFLRDRKGNLRRVEIDGPIAKNTSDENAEQAVEMQIPWVETGDAGECQIVSTLDDGLLMWENNYTFGTTNFLIGAYFSPGIYKYSAESVSGSDAFLFAVASHNPVGGTSYSLTDDTLSGTMTFTEVTTLYGGTGSGTASVTGLVVRKIEDYEASDTPVSGQINIDQYGYGTQIEILDVGSAYTWSYTDADIPDGATVTLKKIEQSGDTVTQTTVGTIDNSDLTGSFTTSSGMDSVTLWLVTDTGDAVQVNGWTLTKTGSGGGDEPEVTSSEVNYLLVENLSAGTWQYSINDVTYTNAIVGKVLTVSDGTSVNQFSIGTDASGTFTVSEPVNVYIYNASGTEFTIGSYSFTQTAQPEDPDTGIIYQNDITVESTVLIRNFSPSQGYARLLIRADSYSVSSLNNASFFGIYSSNGDYVSYSVSATTICNSTGYNPTVSGDINSVTLWNGLPLTVPPLTFTNFSVYNQTSGTTLFTAATLTVKYTTLLTETYTAGDYSVYGSSLTGKMAILYFIIPGTYGNTAQRVTLTSTNVTTTQTVTIDGTLGQIYIECPYGEEVSITGLTIVKNS